MGHCVIVQKTPKKSVLCKMTIAITKQRRIAETFHILLSRETRDFVILRETLSSTLL